MSVQPQISVTEWQKLLIQDASLKSGVRLTGICLSHFADWSTGTNVYPSTKTVAERMGIHEKTAQAHIRKLREEGWIVMVKEGSAHRPHTYRLAEAPNWRPPDLDGDEELDLSEAPDFDTQDEDAKAPAEGREDPWWNEPDPEPVREPTWAEDREHRQRLREARRRAGEL